MVGLAQESLVFEDGNLRVVDDDFVPNQLLNPVLASAKPATVQTVPAHTRSFTPLAQLGSLSLEEYEASFPLPGEVAARAKGKGRPGKKARARAAAAATHDRVSRHGTVHDTTGRHPAVQSVADARRPPREMGRRARVRKAKAHARVAAAQAREAAAYAAAGHRMRGVVARLTPDLTSFAGLQRA
tara:strand:- start:1361 stop:1915 length:555 start_codon:yes stop_codon:yes gene_type:complete